MTEFIGPGKLSELTGIFEEKSIRSCFLVADPTAYVSSGASERLRSLLRSLDTVTVFSDFAPNPDDTSVEKARHIAKQSAYDAVVAIGGGTAIDIAKLLSCSLDTPLSEVIADQNHIHRSISLIAIPTTAGTGSEATHFAVLYVGGIKQSIAHDRLLPDICIVDSDLLKSVPSTLAAHTGLDAFCQSIESMWSIHSTETSDEFAAEGLLLSFANLTNVVNNPDASSREAMSRAAHLSGKAINLSKTTASHAISYTMTSKFGIPHGLAVALTIGPLLLWNSEVSDADCTDPRGASHVRDTLARMLNILSCDTPEQAAERIDQLLAAVGCPTRLAEYGIGHAEIDSIVASINAERLGNNPRRLTDSDLCSILGSRL